MMLRFLLRLIGSLPLPLLHAIGWLVGWGMWLIPNSQRRTATQQVKWCLPELSEQKQKKIIRQSLIETAKAVAETPAFWFGPMRRIKRWVNNDQVINMFKTRTENGTKAAIFLTPHLGAWEITGFAASQIGSLTALYKPQNRSTETANDIMIQGRSRIPNVTLASTDAGGVRLLMQALKKQEMVGILPDHDPPENAGQFAPLFGHPAHTINLVSKLAEKTKAPVAIFIAERLSWGRGFRFHCFDLPPEIADPVHGPTVMNKALEECIMRWPGQYWWGYKRFRRLPSSIQSPYHQ